MAREYLVVLKAMKKDVIVVGRGKENIELLKSEFPEFAFMDGGLKKYLDETKEIHEYAINATSANQLSSTTKMLLNFGVKSILLEKPGDLFLKGLMEIESLSFQKLANVYIAFNRRFYSSIQALKKEVINDGGILSAHFEFTEWAHTIDHNKFDHEVLHKWIVSNSAHVIDTIFYLIGKPNSMHNMISGEGLLPWHSSGSIFIGMGKSVNNIPFSYHSNWNSAGRWAIEVSTAKRRFYLKPMEKLFAQKLGTVSLDEIEVDDALDTNYKPGLYSQVQKFLDGDCKELCTLEEQRKSYENIYMKIGAYTS